MYRLAVSAWGKCVVDHPPAEIEELLQLLRQQFQLVRLSDPTAEGYVSIDLHAASFRKVASTVPVAKRLLVALEPKATNPRQHSLRWRRRFGSVVVLSPLQRISDSDIVSLFGVLDPSTYRQSLYWYKRPKISGSVGVVNENKFSYVRGNHYRTRVEAIKQIAAFGFPVHLGGRNWDKSYVWNCIQLVKTLIIQVTSGLPLQSLFQSPPKLKGVEGVDLAGRVASAVEYLSHHEFALIIENDSEYLSEKLFNAVAAGCVPLYVGPDLGLFGIPNDTVVHLDPRAHNFGKVLRAISAEQKERVLKSGATWLKEVRESEEWTRERSFRRIYRIIVNAFLPSCESTKANV